MPIKTNWFYPAIVLLVALSGNAVACSCASGDADPLEYGNVIGQGKILSIAPLVAGASDSFDSEAVVELSDIWKGDPPARTTLRFRAGDGADCGPVLIKGETISFTAVRSDEGLILPSSCEMFVGNSEYLNAYKSETEALTRALTDQPNNDDIRVKLADHLIVGSEFDRALALYQQVLKRHRGHPGALAGLALIALGKGNTTEARAQVDAGIKLAPNDAKLGTLRHNLMALSGGIVDLSLVNFRDLSTADLAVSGVDLSNVDFSGVRLRRSTFSGVKLDGSRFTDARLWQTSFAMSSLRGANFRNVIINPWPARDQLPLFYGASLRRADLSWDKTSVPRDLDLNHFLEADLEGTHLAGNALHFEPGGVGAYEPATFAKADLNGAEISCKPLSESFSPIAWNSADHEKNWPNALHQLEVIREMIKNQPKAIWDSNCAKEADYYLSLPKDCRPWADDAARTAACTFLSE